MPSAFGSRMERADRSALEVTEEERRAEYERRWERGGLPFLGAFNDLLLDKSANDTAAEFVREKLHEIVRDPDTARKLTPDQVVGCKRLCVDTGYWDDLQPAARAPRRPARVTDRVDHADGHPDHRRATTSSTC